MKKMLVFCVSLAFLSMTSFTTKDAAFKPLPVKHAKKAVISISVDPIDLSSNQFSFHADGGGQFDDAELVSDVYARLLDRIEHIDGVNFTISYGVNIVTGKTVDPAKSLRDNGIQNFGGIYVFGFVD
jgi:hypothetical protein